MVLTTFFLALKSFRNKKRFFSKIAIIINFFENDSIVAHVFFRNSFSICKDEKKMATK